MKEDQMNKKITVQVIGCTGTGKSAIAELLRHYLDISGINVVLNDDEAPGVIAESLNHRLKSLKEKGITVEVQTIRKLRSSFEKY